MYTTRTTYRIEKRWHALPLRRELEAKLAEIPGITWEIEVQPFQGHKTRLLLHLVIHWRSRAQLAGLQALKRARRNGRIDTRRAASKADPP